jgi:broad specificity phosphatase PhoE
VSRLHLWRTVGFHRPSSEGAESYEAFVRRAADRLCRVVDEHPDETTIVVTHVGVIRAAMWIVGAARLGSGFFLTMRNASLTEFIHDPERYEPFDWSLVRYNDFAHLQVDDLDAPPGTQRWPRR